MAELLPQERLQPSLLDRLTDEIPDKKVESRAQRVLSPQRLRESVKRDISWLLNTGNLASLVDLKDYPFVAKSVLNYGMPDLAGLSTHNIAPQELEEDLREALLNFEPRIEEKNLHIRLVLDGDKMNKSAVTFEIEGELWAHPMPLRVYLKTEVDLELGNVTISEFSGSGSG